MKKLLAAITMVLLILSVIGCTVTSTEESLETGNTENLNKTEKYVFEEQESINAELPRSIGLQDRIVTINGIRFEHRNEADGWGIPGEEELYLFVSVTVENIGSERLLVSSSDFWVVDEEKFAQNSAPKYVASGKSAVDPGFAVNLEIAFVVPTGTRGMSLQYPAGEVTSEIVTTWVELY